MTRVERDIAKNERNVDHALSELAGIKVDISETRHLVTLESSETRKDQSLRIATAATSGAAQGSSEGVSGALRGYNKLIQGVGLMTAITFLISFIDNGPKLLNAFLKLFSITATGGPE